jgi:hypothetical protein
MTAALIVYPDMEQRSDEWYEARRGIVTASAVGALLTPTLKVASNDTSRSLTRLLVSERITGRVIPTFTSDAMMRGILDEPLARDLYSETYAPVTESGFMVRELAPGVRLGYSPDGLVGDDGLIEIKSAEPKIHLNRILGAHVDHAHMAQMQAGLLVSGRDWCDYVSYCGGMPMYKRRVTADPAWAKALNEAVEVFESNVYYMLEAYERAVEYLPPTEYVDHFAEIEV